MSAAALDRAFLERVAEEADLNALRTALYQTTGDESLLAYGPVAALEEADQGRLRADCVALLDGDRSGWKLRVPDDDEVQASIRTMHAGGSRCIAFAHACSVRGCSL